jgi:hypothetical protein
MHACEITRIGAKITARRSRNDAARAARSRRSRNAQMSPFEPEPAAAGYRAARRYRRRPPVDGAVPRRDHRTAANATSKAAELRA